MKRCFSAIAVLLIPCLISIPFSGCGSSGGRSAAAGATATSDSVARVEQDALQQYHYYLEAKAGLLVQWTEELRGQLVAAEVGKAQSRYATSRVQYGQLLPIADQFKALALRINGLPGEQPHGRFLGFHKIERKLFGEERTAGLKAPARVLSEDVGRLHHALRSVELDPRSIAISTRELLGEIATKKIQGREEPYSHIDLVDISAATEGAERAFETIRPLLIASDPDLVGNIEFQFVKLYSELSRFGSPGRQPQTREPAAGAVFQSYEALSQKNIDELAEPLRVLIRAFAEVPEHLPKS